MRRKQLQVLAPAADLRLVAFRLISFFFETAKEALESFFLDRVDHGLEKKHQRRNVVCVFLEVLLPMSAQRKRQLLFG